MVKEGFFAQFYGKSQNYTDIPNKWYKEYSAKKGLRNEDGTEVWIGLTRVAGVMGCEEVDGRIKAVLERLLYRGVNVLDLVEGKKEGHFGYEKTCFLLLSGYSPKKTELEKFCNVVRHCYTISDDFVEMNPSHFPGKNLMNKLQDTALTLYNYNDDPDDTDAYQTLVEGVNLLIKPPSITCYAYQSKVHYYGRESPFIHYTDPEYSIVENLLSLLRENQKFTSKKANLLDTILMPHADHSSGNDSTFTNVVTASTDTDIYSTVCGGIDSLKGPHHGGTSTKVAEMIDTVLAETGSYDADDKRIRQSVEELMAGEPYGRPGLVYDFGHVIHIVSGPRAGVLKTCYMGVAREQKHTRELDFYIRFKRIAKEIMEEIKGEALSTNVDFYSGFAHDVLRIPRDLYTLLLACSRAVGWVAHSVENKLYDDRIIRPATKRVGDNMDYVSMPER